MAIATFGGSKPQVTQGEETQSGTASPMEQMGATAAGSPDIADSELYTVDRATETVQGQLESITSNNNPILKREAQMAKDKAAARGLGNSTIATQAGSAAVLDKSTDWAKTDAAIYNNRKTENVRAATNIYGIDQGVESARETAEIAAESAQTTANIQAESQKYASDVAAASSAYTANSARSTALQVQASREKVAYVEMVVQANMQQLNRESQASISKYTADMSAQTSLKGTVNTAKGNSYNQFMTGIANIDQTASASSQQEKYDRLVTVHNAQLEAIDAWS